MPIAINGSSNTITGLAVGGLPDGIVDTDMVAANAVTTAKLATSPQQGLAKAWVNFNGTGTLAVRDSLNVSSVTDDATGQYTVNFTSAMANANYCVTVSTNQAGGNSNACYTKVDTYTTASVKIAIVHTGAFQDQSIVCISVFGD